jgi:hypothetical protein
MADTPVVIDELDDLRQAVAGTPLQDLAFARSEVLDTGLFCFEADVPGDRYAYWRAARALVGVTGRWPVLSWQGAPNVFSRDQHSHGDLAEASPSAIIERGAATTLDAAIEQSLAWRTRPGSPPHWRGADWHRLVGMEVDRTRRRIGDAAPTPDEVARVVEESDEATLNRHLFALEERVRPTTTREPEPEYVPWQDDDDVLLLLPTAVGFNAPAFIDYNICARGWPARDGHAALIAALRTWQARYGAELMVTGDGSWLHLAVERPPADARSAFALAEQLQLFGFPDGPGVRSYARDLIGRTDWYLQERF